MKKAITLLLLAFLFKNIANAQNYNGFLTDNYSGVHGLISNPANITDSRLKTDVNLASVSTFFGNDYYGIQLSDLTNSDFDFEADAIKNPTDNNNVYGNVDILGPSFQFNLNKKSSLAIFSRMRVNYNINEINGNTIDSFSDDFDETEDFNINEGDFYLAANAWAEVGITYARTIYNKEKHFLKGGFSLKYLQGLGNAYSSGKEVTIDYDADGSDLGGGMTVGSINSTGEVTYGHSDNIEGDFENFEIVNEATGLGIDLGFVYEYRPKISSYTMKDEDENTYQLKEKNKYKLKLGFSITDIGSITYQNATAEVYDITNSVNEDDFSNEDSFDDILNNLYTEINSQTSTKSMLPTALHLNADWNMLKKFYLNVNADISLSSISKENTNRIANIISITPRFESKWFSLYVPISQIEGSGLQYGAGLRCGPLYFGSGSILSLLTSDNSKAADVYLGLKIPVYQGKSKNKNPVQEDI